MSMSFYTKNHEDLMSWCVLKFIQNDFYVVIDAAWSEKMFDSLI
jgi:hypothetical protein